MARLCQIINLPINTKTCTFNPDIAERIMRFCFVILASLMLLGACSAPQGCRAGKAMTETRLYFGMNKQQGTVSKAESSICSAVQRTRLHRS